MFSEKQFKGEACVLNYAQSAANGPPLLFLHGVSRRWTDFSPLFSAFESRWQIFALDFRGHGNSAWAEGRYLVSDYLSDVREFLAKEFERPAMIYGHSLGAMVALGLAAEIPERVRAMVLEDPPFETMGREIRSTAYYAQFELMMKLAREGGSVAEVARQLGNLRVQTPSGERLLSDLRDGSALRFSATCLSKVDPTVFAPILAGRWLEGFDYRACAQRVACPALLLQGDPALGGALRDADADMLGAMRDCVRVKFSSGHLIHWDQTTAVVRTVLSFIESL